ncbi:MAG TPA: DMT family transporter [Ignavibacteria bacterium]|nr:DMT family transporter [Ignavibacteria bacterium]
MLKNPKYFSIIILTTLSLIWGSSFILIKKSLIGFSSGQVASLRIIFAFIVLFPVALPRLKKITLKQYKFLFLVGLTANLLPAFLFAKAETGLESGLTGVLNSLTPMFTLIVGLIAFNGKLRKGELIGLIIGLIGSAGLSFVSSSGELSSMNFYALFVVAATICYGISANIIKVHLNDFNPKMLTSVSIFTIAPFAIIYLFTTDFFTHFQNTSETWTSLGAVFILGAVGTAFALILFNRLIQTTSAVSATSVTYLIPIIAILWGIIDGEAFFPLHLLGIVLIIIGVYFVTKANTKVKKEN